MRILFAAALIAATANGALAHSSQVGRKGDAAKVAQTIVVMAHDTADFKTMSFEPAAITIKRGDTVRFVVRNHGSYEHELVIDTFAGNAKHKIEMQKNPDMEHDDPNAVRVKPGKDGTITWQFTRPGTFEYACLIPGHYEAGMKGRIIVK